MQPNPYQHNVIGNLKYVDWHVLKKEKINKTVNRYSHTVATERIKVIVDFVLQNSMFDDFCYFFFRVELYRSMNKLLFMLVHNYALRSDDCQLTFMVWSIVHDSMQFSKETAASTKQQQRVVITSVGSHQTIQFCWSLDSCFGFFFYAVEALKAWREVKSARRKKY